MLGALGASLGGVALLQIAPRNQKPDPHRLRPPGARENTLLAADKAATKPVATTQVKESGKINLNTASASELTALKGIGEKKAQAIIQ